MRRDFNFSFRCLDILLFCVQYFATSTFCVRFFCTSIFSIRYFDVLGFYISSFQYFTTSICGDLRYFAFQYFVLFNFVSDILDVDISRIRYYTYQFDTLRFYILRFDILHFQYFLPSISCDSMFWVSIFGHESVRINVCETASCG